LVNGDSAPYLVVANSLSNNVLVDHYDPPEGKFDLSATYTVGDNPVSVTVADVNNDGVPDLLIANEGSNDVSVLIGSTQTGVWTATPYQRLNSGGSGPTAVSMRQNANGVPDLVVTNGQSGTLTVLPGVGQGFFNDTNPQPPISLGGTPRLPSTTSSGFGVVPVGNRFPLSVSPREMAFAAPERPDESTGKVLCADSGASSDTLPPRRPTLATSAHPSAPEEPVRDGEWNRFFLTALAFGAMLGGTQECQFRGGRPAPPSRGTCLPFGKKEDNPP
jgi:hypothetical protein